MTVKILGATLAFVLLGVAHGAQAADAKCQLVKLVELPVTMVGSKPIVTVKINGQETRLVADSGAFFSMLTPAAADRLGIKSSRAPPEAQVYGFGGGETFVRIGKAKDVEFGDLPPFHGVSFLVGGSDLGAEVSGLLGQNLLGATDVEYDLANGVIRLFSAKGCGLDTTLAYWAAGKPYSAITIPLRTAENPHITAPAEVDGKPIRVLFDTGASTSFLSRSAAARAGIKLATEGVTDGGIVRGISMSAVETSIVPFASFGIGNEEIRNTRLRVAKVDMSEDMLLGADFFLSHRVFVATSQRRIYFTYNGGPVFRLDAARTTAAATSGGETPADAAAFARRGAASAARRDYPSAIADFSRAAELEPTDARHLLGRANARLGAGQATAALADLDQALKLKPDQPAALMQRARIHLAGKDMARARKDLDATPRAALTSYEQLELGQLYAQAGLFERAVAEYSSWLLSHPKDPLLADALNARCWARATWGQQLKEGLADCNEGLRKSPRDAGILDSRGLIHLRLGQLDESIADYDAALKLQPKTAWSLYGRGLARERKGLKEAGAADIRAAIAIEPTLPEDARRFGL